MSSYFDLNKGSSEIPGQEPDAPASASRAAARLPAWEQVVMYLGVLAGVILSTVLTDFRFDKRPVLSFSWASLPVAALVALVLIPATYDKLRVRNDAPFLVRFALFVQTGVFWQVVFGALGKVIGG